MILSVVDVQNEKSMKNPPFSIEVFLRKVFERLFLISELETVLYIG